ncbi:MAG: MEDS domain-containing protein [Spirochaetes bacterium]|nr:MEDS domain-containing protein [Spirochaetota bacterium]
MHINTSRQQKLNMGFGAYTCNWGTHFCGLYETEDERDEIIFGFLHQGAVEKDLQLYCPAERSREEFIAQYTNYTKGCSTEISDSNLFRINSARELYYPEGKFSPDYMDESLNSLYINSQKNGKRNVRASAEMVWALEAVPGKEHLMVYESRLNYFIQGKPWTSICLYNVNKFDGATIMNVLRTHPYCISKGIISENPFYQDPDIWLSENAPEYLPGNIK